MKQTQNSRVRMTASMLAFVTFIGSAVSSHAADSFDRPDYYPISLGADASTAGFGGSATWRFCDHFGVRGGGDYMSYNHSGTIEGQHYTGKLQLLSGVFTLNWYPWVQHSFYVSAGLALNQNKFEGTGENSAPLTINGHTYGGAGNPTLGTLNLEIRQQPINGYLSIGGNMFYFDKAHHWAFTGELGAMYGGKPKVSLTSSGASGAAQSQINADLASEQQKIQHYANYLQFWPVVKIGVGFSF